MMTNLKSCSNISISKNIFFDYSMFADCQSTYNSSYINDLLTLMLFSIILSTWFLCPIFAILPILAFLAFVKNPRFVKHLFLLLVASSMGLINWTRLPDSDLENYYITFSFLNTIPFYKFHEALLLDPAFYLPSAILAHITNGYGPAFILFWTIIIYYVLFLAIIELSNALKLKDMWVIAIIFYSISAGYIFSLTSHLVRQYVAMSFLIYAIAFAINGKKSAYFFFLIASSIHITAIIFFPLIYLIKKDTLSTHKVLTLFLPVFIFVALAGSSNFLSYASLIPYTSIDVIDMVSDKATRYVDANSGDLSLRIFIGLMLFISIPTSIFFLNSKYKKIGLKLLFMFMYLMCIFVLFRNNDLLMLRFFFYSYGLIIISLPYTAKFINYLTFNFLFILALTAPIRFIIALKNSPNIYIDNSYMIIFYSFFDFLNFTSG